MSKPVPEEYLYYPNGVTKKAVLVYILRPGECARKWERKENHFTDRRKVYKRL